MSAVVLGLTVAELIQIGLAAPSTVKSILDVVEEVKKMGLHPGDPVPSQHVARVRAAVAQITPRSPDIQTYVQEFLSGEKQ